MASGDMQVRLTVKDEVTPVLQRLRREVWWFQYGDRVIGALAGTAIFAAGVLLGSLIR